jgi:hypothetical protein
MYLDMLSRAFASSDMLEEIVRELTGRVLGREDSLELYVALDHCRRRDLRSHLCQRPSTESGSPSVHPSTTIAALTQCTSQTSETTSPQSQSRRANSNILNKISNITTMLSVLPQEFQHLKQHCAGKMPQIFTQSHGKVRDRSMKKIEHSSREDLLSKRTDFHLFEKAYLRMYFMG